jgi:two-component system, NarL family, nitrate/nitrite response regulator NarL
MRTAVSEFTITVLVAERGRMDCQLLETALRRNRKLSVVASAVETPEFVEAYKISRPDVCVVSDNLKDGPTAGFRAVRELRAIDREARVIMLLESPERPLVIEAFRSGARGVFSRDEPFGALCKCIQRVYDGNIWASSEQLCYLVETVAEAAPPAITDAKGASLLTNRELSIVQLVSEGRTNRDISRELNLSEHTVRNYLFRIFNKLGTSNRLELALYAISRREADHDPAVGRN